MLNDLKRSYDTMMNDSLSLATSTSCPSLSLSTSSSLSSSSSSLLSPTSSTSSSLAITPISPIQTTTMIQQPQQYQIQFPTPSLTPQIQQPQQTLISVRPQYQLMDNFQQQQQQPKSTFNYISDNSQNSQNSQQIYMQYPIQSQQYQPQPGQYPSIEMQRKKLRRTDTILSIDYANSNSNSNSNNIFNSIQNQTSALILPPINDGTTATSLSLPPPSQQQQSSSVLTTSISKKPTTLNVPIPQPLPYQQKQIDQHLLTTNHTNRILPIDTCEHTINLETQFISDYTPKEYTFELDKTSTVVYSRALKTSYLWPKDRPLTIDSLKTFATNGHTLGIDYRSTYCRMFALDIDCPCRRSGSTFEHLNENIIMTIVERLQTLFKVAFNLDAYTYSIWRNNCGFHLYTDVPVTIPTHLFIKKQLEASLNLQNQPCVIEVPNIMPLPYSAKVRNEAYQPVNISSNLDSIPLTIYKEGQSFFELFSFQRIALSGRTVAKINSIIGEEYLVKLTNYTIRKNNPRLVNISSIQLYQNFEYMQQFQEYITIMVAQYNAKITSIQNIDLSDFSEDERTQIRIFMGYFNRTFGVSGGVSGLVDESCDTFIRLAALEYGGLYLQPFLAAFYLNLQFHDQFTSFDRFKKLLEKIFESAMIQYKSIEWYINLLTVQSLQEYADEGWENIIHHLHYLISHNTLPTQTLNEKIDTIMQKLTDTTADVVREAIHKEGSAKDKSRAEAIITDLLDKFRDIFLEMKVIFFDQSSSRYFYLNHTNGVSYDSSAKLIDTIPAVVRSWIGYSQVATVMIRNYFEKSRDIMLAEPIKFTTTKYMYATSVGVFNSAVGLYTAQTRFLRFNKYRQISIWPHCEPEKIFYAQNEAVLAHYHVVRQLLDDLDNKLFALYTHSVFAPAIIQLRSLMLIEERFIEQLFRMLGNHHNADNYDCAKFLLEYYQFDPKIVYLIIHLCNEYGGIEIFYSYSTLCSKIFQTEYVTSIIWSEKFQSIMSNARYDNTLSTYTERLESLHGENMGDMNSISYISIIILLACIIKCDSFTEFVRAFDITLPDTINEHPKYKNVIMETNIYTMKDNFNRARNIVFGDKLTPFEDALIDELFSICMSTDFKPETIQNYLVAVGAMFIPINVSKKLILFQGGADVGKSLACKKLAEMAKPSVARLEDISSVMTRASIAEYSLVIINEAKALNAAQLKIVTGNDDTSRQLFYTQKYELQQMQTLMFGATNIHVTFKGGDDIDKTSVERLYAIMFTGRNVPAESLHPSLLAMMVDGCYFSGMFSPIFKISVDSLRWLSFGIYMQKRDINCFPSLNLNCDSCRDYQHIVYYNNSALYKFLADLGIVDAPGFTLSKDRLLHIVRQNLDKNGKFPTMSAFRSAFEKQYNVSFNNNDHIKNMQQAGLIQHIMDNMRVVEQEGAVITKDDLDVRLKKYTFREHHDNALAYFARAQVKHYDHINKVYHNITFVSSNDDAYDGNEILTNNYNDFSIDRDSLVMKSI